MMIYCNVSAILYMMHLFVLCASAACFFSVMLRQKRAILASVVAHKTLHRTFGIVASLMWKLFTLLQQV